MHLSRISITAWLLLGVFLFALPLFGQAQNATFSEGVGSAPAEIFMFGRDECGFCRAQKAFLDAEGIPYQYLNIATDSEAAALYDQVVAKHGVSKVTPITVVGAELFVGYNSDRTTGENIRNALTAAQTGEIRTLKDHLERAPVSSGTFEGGCSGLGCEAGSFSEYTFDLPLVGLVDLKSFSLFTLSLVLGTIDGFNPCAMWVLITFLVLLSQAGSRQKMVLMAGIFIVAEAVMYNFILNAWYKTWDFVALDAIVTPVVGLLALGGGLFFLSRWRKNKSTQLVCDITNIDTQMKTIGRFKAIASQPVTVASILAILVIAFSVNVIEFACSIGIPQAYTKILEINALTFIERQWFILVYTFGYMVDDFLVFGLAIWGYDKLQSHGGRYAQLSLLIGGTLMVLLGLVLIINPTLLML